jgi:hypothetical protein
VFVAIGAGALVNRWWVVLVALAVPLLALPLGTDVEGQAEWAEALLVGFPLAVAVATARITERIRETPPRPNPPSALST